VIFFLFADDAKIIKHVARIEDCSQLQNSCGKLLEWSNTWQLKLNIKNLCYLDYLLEILKYDSKYILNNSGNPEELKEVNNM
jgi:hypothetical protein